MIRVGIGGWNFAPWRGVFYPKGLQQRRELEFASRMFPSIELNGSFYSLQRPENYASWYDEPQMTASGEQLLNREAFVRPPAGQLGNTARNAFRGPGLFSLDASVARSFRLDLLFARDEGNRLGADPRDDLVVDLARQQAQRQADHAARMRQHALDGEMGLARIGGA
jgi:hypothetical protein